jgi:hypothetical protein
MRRDFVSWHASGNKPSIQTVTSNADRPGLGQMSALPVQRVRSPKLLLMLCMPHGANVWFGLVVVTTLKGRAWFDSMQTTTGSSVW